MNLTTIAIGVAAIGFGLTTAYLRVTKPAAFKKLEAMKKMWGNTAGTVVHVIAYTVIPIVAGIIFLVQGISGVSFF